MCNIIIGGIVKRSLLFSISLSVLAASLSQSPASAQSRYYGYEEGPMLVAPDGAILDYVPNGGGISITRDRAGQRVYVDSYGNVIATEMHRDGYRGGNIGYPPPPGYGNNRRDQARYDDQSGYGYRDYRQYRPGDPVEPGATTGSIGRQDQVTRMPLDQQELPGVDQGYPEEASLEPNPSMPPAEQLHPNKPVATVANKPQAEIAALQVFLDREGISPGVIDGRLGDNVNKAIAAWQEMTGETLDPNNSEEIMQRLTYSGGLPIVDYTITPADAAGPYVASIPEDYAHKAALPAMSFTSVTEKLAEQFHMDENYLKSLNPNADFSIPGTIIKVVNPAQPKKGEVTRIVADKARKQVFAYGADNNLIAAYPATIGSSDTPSPTGNHTVQRIALDPGYTYNPKINFTQGNNTEILQIPPGPNGPVGTVWIALSKPTYGIHGTPEPSKIGKTNSHGCVRLTNWDATELAKMVKPGTTVEFVE
ncbi:Lipoprotein-anchoring transpeptidase ErfK/SrfK [Rhizobium sp. NFR07]|nr:Lipoprotein-anchoring transpeptidase ErfK/SrfK [Rhizobium sp. NFR07]